MQIKPGLLTAVAMLGLLRPISLVAQTTNPPYLSQMPTVERIKAEIKGTDSMETAARLMGTFWQLRELVYDLGWRTGRRGRDDATPDEKRLANAYYAAYYYASQPYLHIQNSPSHPDKPKWYKMHATYETDPGFLDELFKRFFSSQFRTEVYQVTGKQPPQPTSAKPSESASTEASAYSAQGKKYLDSKDYTKAIEAYKKAIALNPSTSVAHNNLGLAYSYLKQYPDAVAAYQEAIRLKSDDATYHRNLGSAYDELKRYESAVASYREALRLKPDDATASHHLGIAYYNQKQYRDALEAFQQALRLNYPKPEYSHSWIGDTYRQSKQDEQAITAYREALRVKPDYDYAHNQLGRIYQDQKKYANAVAEYKEAVRWKPSEAVYHYNLGTTYNDLKQYDSARVSLREAIRLNPKDPEYYNQLGLASLYKPIDETPNQTKSARTPAEIQLSSADSAYKAGMQLKDKKEWTKSRAAFDSAIAFYKKAITLTPSLVEAYSNLGMTYVEQGYYRAAIDTLKKALALNPNHSKSFNSLGLAYLYQEQFPSAVAAFEQAVRLKPGEAVYHYNLGYSYADMGKKDEALKVYKTLEKIDKTWAQKLDEKINKATKLSTTTPRPKTFSNPKIELVWIPPGSYMMGSQYAPHQVTIGKGFYMGKYEVTQAQWQMVMGDNPSFFKNCGSDCPVEQVSWNDAQEFVSRLNTLNDGYKYRLPSEAEWEYAYRAGTTAYYYGPTDDIGWHSGLGSNPGNSGGKTHPVGGKLPNAFGLYDMPGNVCEWCMDWYQSDYKGAPTDGSARLVADVMKYRVIRGGSFYGAPAAQSADSRTKDPPDAQSRNNGLRVVAERQSTKLSASEATSAANYVAEGDKLYETKDYSRAAEAYRKAIALQPSLAKAFYGLGSASLEKKEYEAAVLFLKEALRLKSDDALASQSLGKAYYWIGRTYIDQKQYAKAVSFFQEALRLKYEDAADANNRLGLAHFYLGKYPEALAAFQLASRIKPSEGLFHQNIGVTYTMMGKKDEALQVHKTLQAIDTTRARQLSEAIKKMK